MRCGASWHGSREGGAWRHILDEAVLDGHRHDEEGTRATLAGQLLGRLEAAAISHRAGLAGRKSVPVTVVIVAGVKLLLVLTLVLLFMGRAPWCECGYIKFWHGIVLSPENSQHFSDWYTFSHIIHGIGFYALLRLIGRRGPASSAANRMGPIGLWLVLAILFEASWEVFENTDFVINRYRRATISLDYYGDSVINSVGDILAMVLGFALAARLPIWATVVLVVGLEALVAYWVRDNLMLNIIMLIYPFETIQAWQLGG